jgi:hypothetical protein
MHAHTHTHTRIHIHTNIDHLLTTQKTKIFFTIIHRIILNFNWIILRNKTHDYGLILQDTFSPHFTHQQRLRRHHKIFIKNGNERDLSFPQRRQWVSKPCGTWRRADRYAVTATPGPLDPHGRVTTIYKKKNAVFTSRHGVKSQYTSILRSKHGVVQKFKIKTTRFCNHAHNHAHSNTRTLTQPSTFYQFLLST